MSTAQAERVDAYEAVVKCLVPRLPALPIGLCLAVLMHVQAVRPTPEEIEAQIFRRGRVQVKISTTRTGPQVGSRALRTAWSPMLVPEKVNV